MSRGLGRASVQLLASTWGHGALGIVISVMIARGLGPDAVGDLAVNLGLATLVMAALLPGFGRAHLKRLAEGQDAGLCVGTMLTLQAALTLLVFVVAALATAAGWAPSVHASPVFAFMLAAQITGRFADVFQQVFLAREWVLAHGLVLLGARLARLVATVAVLAWAPEVAWVAATFCVESALLALGAALLLAARYRVTLRAPTASSLRGYWTYARPLLITTPISLVQDSIDRVLVGRWAGLTAAGYYHVARSLWEVLGSVMAPPGLFLFTRLSSLYAVRSPERDREARALFDRTLDRILFVTAPLAFGFWALAEAMIGVMYGGAFAPAAAALRVLVLAALVANVVNPYTFVLQAQDEIARFVPVGIVRFVAYLAVLAVLVHGAAAGWLPFSPATGAAGARVFLVLFLTWVYVRWSRELAGIPLWRRAWVYAVSFSVAILAYHAARPLTAGAMGEGLAGMLGPTVLGGAVYAALLAWLHPEARGHFREVLGLLSPRGVRTLFSRRAGPG